MSSVLRPRGPQKASVYWRRRAVAIVIVVAVPLTLALLLFTRGSGQPTADASGQGPSAGATPTASPTTTQEPDPDEDPTASPTPSAAGVPACPEGAVQVEVSTDKEVYGPGENPQITMKIINTSDTGCLRDIGSGANTVKVSSGGYHAWSSDDCDPSQAANEQTLPAQGQAAATVVWERKLSAPGCAGPAADARPGVYQVEARNGEVVSSQVRFTIQ